MPGARRTIGDVSLSFVDQCREVMRGARGFVANQGAAAFAAVRVKEIHEKASGRNSRARGFYVLHRYTSPYDRRGANAPLCYIRVKHEFCAKADLTLRSERAREMG